MTQNDTKPEPGPDEQEALLSELEAFAATPGSLVDADGAPITLSPNLTYWLRMARQAQGQMEYFARLKALQTTGDAEMRAYINQRRIDAARKERDRHLARCADYLERLSRHFLLPELQEQPEPAKPKTRRRR